MSKEKIELLGGNRAEIRNFGHLGFLTFVIRSNGDIVTTAWHYQKDWALSWALGFNAHFEG